MTARVFGAQAVFGTCAPLPLEGFPEGKTRIRMRPEGFAQVFVRPPEGGARRFYIQEPHGKWFPLFEVGANRVVETSTPKEDA